MPCDQIILNKIEISATNLDVLTKALESLITHNVLPRSSLGGRNVREQAALIIRQGFVSVPRGQEYLADRIKQEYSRQSVQSAARKLGWRLVEHTPQKFIATRRA